MIGDWRLVIEFRIVDPSIADRKLQITNHQSQITNAKEA
jgi:hypothetical protein